MARRKKYKPRGKLGSGSRFKRLTKELASRRGKTRTGKSRKVRNPQALAAWIGRKKYGKKKMAKLAAAGRKKKRKKK